MPEEGLGPLKVTHKVHRKDSDENQRMPRLIRMFAGHTGYFVGAYFVSFALM